MFSLGLRPNKVTRNASASSSNKGKKVATIKQFLVGSDRAVVAKSICPDCPGRVRYQATWWPAQCEQGIELRPGDEVRVIGISNITLLVEPMLSAAA